MESKLNEILELCVQKSCHENNVFYYFKFNPVNNHVLIDKGDCAGNRLGFKSEKDGRSRALGFYLDDESVDIALDYMRDE